MYITLFQTVKGKRANELLHIVWKTYFYMVQS